MTSINTNLARTINKAAHFRDKTATILTWIAPTTSRIIPLYSSRNREGAVVVSKWQKMAHLAITGVLTRLAVGFFRVSENRPSKLENKIKSPAERWRTFYERFFMELFGTFIYVLVLHAAQDLMARPFEWGLKYKFNHFNKYFGKHTLAEFLDDKSVRKLIKTKLDRKTYREFYHLAQKSKKINMAPDLIKHLVNHKQLHVTDAEKAVLTQKLTDLTQNPYRFFDNYVHHDPDIERFLLAVFKDKATVKQFRDLLPQPADLLDDQITHELLGNDFKPNEIESIKSAIRDAHSYVYPYNPSGVVDRYIYGVQKDFDVNGKRISKWLRPTETEFKEVLTERLKRLERSPGNRLLSDELIRHKIWPKLEEYVIRNFGTRIRIGSIAALLAGTFVAAYVGGNYLQTFNDKVLRPFISIVIKDPSPVTYQYSPQPSSVIDSVISTPSTPISRQPFQFQQPLVSSAFAGASKAARFRREG